MKPVTNTSRPSAVTSKLLGFFHPSLLLLLCGMVCLPQLGLAQSNSCAETTGLPLIAKYEVTDSGKFKFLSGDPGAITIENIERKDGKQAVAATFTSTLPVGALYVKAGNEKKDDKDGVQKTVLFDPAVFTGSFNNEGSDNNGLSSVSFCQCAGGVAPQVSYSFSNGPDGEEGTDDDEIVINLSDDVALQSFDLTLLDAEGGSPNLFVIENTFAPGVQSAFVRLGFRNFTDNTLIFADVSDGCLSCADTQAPVVNDPVRDGLTLSFLVTDETGLVKVEPFRLGDNFTPTSPPLSPGATTYTAAFAVTPPGGSLGLLAADQCNAFVYDPTLECGATGPCIKSDAAGKHRTGGVFFAEQAAASVPGGFELEGNYPNPFNPSTEIRFALPEAAEVEVSVFDVAGRLVQTLASGTYAAGRHTLTFEASGLPSGVFFYRVQSAGNVQVRPMTLLK